MEAIDEQNKTDIVNKMNLINLLNANLAATNKTSKRDLIKDAQDFEAE